MDNAYIPSIALYISFSLILSLYSEISHTFIPSDLAVLCFFTFVKILEAENDKGLEMNGGGYRPSSLEDQGQSLPTTLSIEATALCYSNPVLSSASTDSATSSLDAIPNGTCAPSPADSSASSSNPVTASTTVAPVATEPNPDLVHVRVGTESVGVGDDRIKGFMMIFDFMSESPSPPSTPLSASFSSLSLSLSLYLCLSSLFSLHAQSYCPLYLQTQRQLEKALKQLRSSQDELRKLQRENMDLVGGGREKKPI